MISVSINVKIHSLNDIERNNFEGREGAKEIIAVLLAKVNDIVCCKVEACIRATLKSMLRICGSTSRVEE